MPADATALSVESNYPRSICRAANGDFLVTQLSMSDETQTVYRYHYDESLPTHAATTLNIWALEDSATARAAVTAYRAAEHPEVDVNFTVALQEDAADPAAARNDALTQLNTQLLAGRRPRRAAAGTASTTRPTCKRAFWRTSAARCRWTNCSKILWRRSRPTAKRTCCRRGLSVPVLVGGRRHAGRAGQPGGAAAGAVLDAAPARGFRR